MSSFLQRSLWIGAVLFLASGCFVGMFSSTVLASTDMPIATTVPLAEEASIGSLVRYDEATDTYALTQTARDSAIYGVVADRPALVFVTATTSIPVVTQGVTLVQVRTENGPVARGDVLTSATGAGVAMVADVADTAVFAVALEAADTDGSILADISVERAKARQAERRAAMETEEDDELFVSTARAVVAAIVAIGALGFGLYSYRTILASGVVSVGRNPRARRSVIGVAIGSMVTVLVLVFIVIFVAVGILVLPL